jgi:probable addiction module antidote protein
MSQIAKTSGLNRESLYKALSDKGNPEFATIMRVIQAMGLTLTARPMARSRAPKRRRAGP